MASKAGVISSLGSAAAAVIVTYLFIGFLKDQGVQQELASKVSREQLTQLIAGQTEATKANASALANLELAVKEANTSVKQIGQVSLKQILGLTERSVKAQEEVKAVVKEVVKPPEGGR
jgi:Glu-tRNA(Gln) amidotransferase subunit E-like FAD-binding protein